MTELTPQERLETLVCDENYQRIADELKELRPHFADEEAIFAHIAAIGNIMLRLKAVATPNVPVVEELEGREMLTPVGGETIEDGTENDYNGDPSSVGDHSTDT